MLAGLKFVFVIHYNFQYLFACYILFETWILKNVCSGAGLNSDNISCFPNFPWAAGKLTRSARFKKKTWSLRHFSNLSFRRGPKGGQEGGGKNKPTTKRENERMTRDETKRKNNHC